MAIKKIIEYKVTETGCHIVTSHFIDRDGYAKMRVGKKAVLIHRHIFKLYHGDIPAGLYVLHNCDNPSCINPNHLVLGTHRDNMRHKLERNRTGKGTDKTRIKLTPDQVKEIRAIGYSMKALDLAKKFNVHVSTIKNIRSGRTWKKGK